MPSPDQLVISPIEEVFVRLVGQAQQSIFLCAPYIKNYAADLLLENAACNR